MAGLLPPGTKAPDFEGIDQDGNVVRLRDFAGRPLVLYFYPADETYGCTREACTFRDEMEKFRSLGAAVVGVSVQDAESHRRFRDRHGLNFPLIADPDRRLTRAYRALGLLGLAKRATYVIGPDGTILASFQSMNPKSHSREALRVVSEYVTSHGVRPLEASPGSDSTTHPPSV